MHCLKYLYIALTLIVALSAPCWARDLSSGSMQNGQGLYFTDDGLNERPVGRVEVELKDDLKFKITADTPEGDVIIYGSWKLIKDETKAIVLDVKRAFKDEAVGSGIIILDEPIDNGGTPKHLILQYKIPSQKTFHVLSYTLPTP